MKSYEVKIHLYNCPFCGGEPEMHFGTDTAIAYAFCTKCKARSIARSTTDIKGNDNSLETVISIAQMVAMDWNIREETK